MIADGFDGFAVHLANHDVTLTAVSRAPLAKLLAYRKRMGWSFPWASSQGGDFNFNFNVSFTEQQKRAGTIEYNFRSRGPKLTKTAFPQESPQSAPTCVSAAAPYTHNQPEQHNE